MPEQEAAQTLPGEATGPARSGTGKTHRDLRLDFFRGAALFFIFIDHIPDNPLSYLTLKSFAFADAAEVFIFISGYTAAMVYGRAMGRDGLVLSSIRIWRRVWQLYVAHVLIFMVYAAQVAYAMTFMRNPLFAENLGVGDFLARADVTILRVLLLQFQPTYLDILPLYIALMLTFPAWLVLLRRAPVTGLVLSAALYGAANAWGINLPAYPSDEGWYFNPFAWQFLFVIASVLGLRASEGQATPLPSWLVAGAAAFAAFACVVRLSWVLEEAGWPVPGLLRHLLWPIEKSLLPPLRLLSVLALAVLAGRLVRRDAAFLTSRPGWIVVLCGQQSLDVFCLGILLSVLGGIILTGISDTWAMVAVVNVVGASAMVGLAMGLAWYNGGGRLPARPLRPEPA